MPESTPSVTKTISWILAILLVGVVALYSWHNKNQGEIRAAKDAEIAQSARLLAGAQRKLSGIEATLQTLHTEKQKVSEALRVANQANQTLRNDMEDRATQHAQTLATERETASQAYAELEGRYKATEQQIAALEGNIERLEQAKKDTEAAHATKIEEATAAHKARIAELNASHEAQVAELEVAHESRVQQLEEKLNDKIDFFRQALEGSDPERAAQLGTLQTDVQQSRQAIAEARQAAQAMQDKATSLDGQLKGANEKIAQQEQALSKVGRALAQAQEELTQAQSARTALQEEHNTAVAEAAASLAGLQQELQNAQAAHEKTKAETAAARQAAEENHRSQMTEVRDEISALTGRLQAETLALGALRQKHDAMVAELRGSLDATKRTLADVETKLRTVKEAATQAREAHEQQIAQAQAKADDLQQTLERTQQKAEQDLAATKREGEETLAYLRGIYSDVSKLGGRHTERGMLLSLAEEVLRFRISKADLPGGELPSLDRIAELLLEHPKLTVLIEGHTDSKGREETNLELSQERADAVKQALAERGVSPDRMTAMGIGAARPIADNASSAGRRMNRRVEIYVVEN